MNGRNMIMVDVYVGQIPLKSWKACADLVLSVGPDHDTTYFRMYNSIGWIICMRVIVPLATFLTAGVAINEFIRVHRGWKPGMSTSRTELRRVGLAVSFLMGSTMFFLGALYASGMWTTMTLPVYFYLFCETMFDGIGILATLLLALFMREEWRSNRWNLTRRSLWTDFRITVAVMFVLLFGADIIMGVLLTVGLDENLGSLVFLSTLVFTYSVIYAISGIFFFWQASLLSSPLVSYIRARRGADFHTDEKLLLRLGRLAFVLSMIGFFTLANTAMHIALAVNIAYGVPNPDFYLLNMAGFTLARAGVAYWQVNLSFDPG